MFYSFLCRVVVFDLVFLIGFAPSGLFAETLTFQQVLAAAFEQAYELKISEEDVEASKAAVAEAKAGYYPQLTLHFGQEYVHVYDEYSAVASVGDTVYSDYVSKYKHSLAFYARYNLYDFGRRRLGVQHANQQVGISKLQKEYAVFESSQKLLDYYSEALKLQKRITVIQKILDGRKKMFALSQQLQAAGQYGHLRVGEAAISLAQTVTQLDDLQVEFQTALDLLSFYTRNAYPADSIYLADLESVAVNVDKVVSVPQLPEIKILQQKLERKETELAIAKCELLPELTLQGAYGMYGNDDSSYHDSLDTIRKRDVSITLSFVLPLFDGFANSAQKKRLRHEISRLKIEQQKAMAEWKSRLSLARRSFKSLNRRIVERAQQNRQISWQISDFDRLAQQKMTDQVTLIEKMIELEQLNLDVALQEVDSAAAAIRLMLFQEAGL